MSVKIVIALDSFKGSLSALEACQAAGRGLRGVLPGAEIVLKPMADGGEGTAQAVASSGGGVWRPVVVTGPLQGQMVEAGYVWFPDSRQALVEMASASGLTLLKTSELDPLSTTTFGTGELIGRAVEAGAEKIYLAVGGSATVDGGVGAATALGWKFLDGQGRPLGPGGGPLAGLARIVRPSNLVLSPIDVLCDVTNPLVGPFGAAPVFGPQKGATPDMVVQLDGNLSRLAEVVHRDVGLDIAGIPGGGAAGGLAAGAVAFMGAALVPGIDAVMDATGFRQALVGADWVITGEGRTDDSSFSGKVISGVARAAGESKVRVALLSGSVQVDAPMLSLHGIELSVEAKPESMPLDEAMHNAAQLVEAAALEVGLRIREQT